MLSSDDSRIVYLMSDQVRGTLVVTEPDYDKLVSVILEGQWREPF